MATNPKYPVYVISKGRHDCCLTAKFLIEDGCPFHIVIEPQERHLYEQHFDPDLILDLPFSNLGQGSIPARNWVWEHAKAAGHDRHWILDDNSRGICRRRRALRVRAETGPAFRTVELFVDRYTNITVAGLNYSMFVPDKTPAKPFVRNVHVYSCLLIDCHAEERWRGRYNEDTDLCLQVLSAGRCTVLVNAFTINKIRTMTMKGGNATELYQGDGRLRMARSLERMWPGLVTTERRFDRPQHVVQWGNFTQLLIEKPKKDWPKEAPPVFKVKKLREPDSEKTRRWLEGEIPRNEHTGKGGVPGGHRVICAEGKEPFVPPMTECHSIPLRESDVVVDIGAYCGTYAITAARYPVHRVDAYEPTPSTFSLLDKTRLVNMRNFHAAVVGGDEKSIDLFISTGIGVTNSVVKTNRKAGKVPVKAVNFLEVLADATVVKIDVEGAEYGYPIVEAAKSLPRLRAMIIDFHPMPGDWTARAEAVIEGLKAEGFRTVVKPDWANGWTQAGSWERDTTELPPPDSELLAGIRCCGCSVALHPRGAKALCSACWQEWSKKHRKGFLRAEVASSTAEREGGR